MHKNLFSVFLLSWTTFFVGVVSYLYHPIMLRYLDIDEFAEFESLIGIINLLSILWAALGLFIVKEFARSYTPRKDKVILQVSKKIWWYIWILFYMVFICLSPLLAWFLKIDSYVLIILTGLTLPMWFIGIYQWAYFQWKKQFKTISLIQIINPILRLLIGVWLTFLGFKVFWAIWGFVFAQIFLLILWHILVESRNSKNIEEISKHNKEYTEKWIFEDIKSQKKQLFHYFTTSVILAYLMNADILFAKHFFDNTQAGIYAGISIVAKFLVFVGMSIETVYYPIFMSEWKVYKKKIFIVSSLYILLIVSALAFFAVFWKSILYFMKPWFEDYLNLLYIILIYCWLLSLLNFLVKLLVGYKKYSINYVILGYTTLWSIALYFIPSIGAIELITVFVLMILFSILSGIFILWRTRDISDM